MMLPLSKYLLGQSDTVSQRELNRLIDEYEWFTTARRVRAHLAGEPDSALTLPLGFWPTVPPVPQEVLPVTRSVPAPPVPNVIDRFLEHGDYRIVPTYDAEDVDVEIDVDPELVTEELAEIYRAQGLTEKADEIHRILNHRANA